MHIIVCVCVSIKPQIKCDLWENNNIPDLLEDILHISLP